MSDHPVWKQLWEHAATKGVQVFLCSCILTNPAHKDTCKMGQDRD